jgi:hypothetical protein
LFTPDSGSLHIGQLLHIPEKFLDNPSIAVCGDDLGGFPCEFIGEQIFGGKNILSQTTSHPSQIGCILQMGTICTFETPTPTLPRWGMEFDANADCNDS